MSTKSLPQLTRILEEEEESFQEIDTITNATPSEDINSLRVITQPTVVYVSLEETTPKKAPKAISVEDYKSSPSKPTVKKEPYGSYNTVNRKFSKSKERVIAI